MDRASFIKSSGLVGSHPTQSRKSTLTQFLCDSIETTKARISRLESELKKERDQLDSLVDLARDEYRKQQ